MFDAIDVTSRISLPFRSLIGLMVYSVAGIGAALATKVDGLFMHNYVLLLRLTATASTNRYRKKKAFADELISSLKAILQAA